MLLILLFANIFLLLSGIREAVGYSPTAFHVAAKIVVHLLFFKMVL